MEFEVQFHGVDQVLQRLSAVGPTALKAAASELYQQGEEVLADSKEHYVPVDFGVLKNSGHVQLPTVTDDGIEVRMGYGGAAGAYAVVQHERLDFRHTVGGPKYLERPLLAAVRRIRAALADAVKRALR